MKLIPLPAFADNYIWMLHDESRALVVDPGDPQPVIKALQRLGVKLEAILVTHHHPDHTGGVKALRESTGAAVFGPARETMPEPLTRLQDNDLVMTLGLSFKVIDVPGHTAGHIAYYCESDQGSPLLFCGDTLFSGGCGRLFEGTPAQMLASLDRLAALPEATRVCCTHEYTLNNLKFALAVDPHNETLQRYMESAQALRDNGQPTLPSSLALERQINPFLRSRLPALIRAAQSFNTKAHDEVSHFAALRQWKNQF
jgi:hydroxyacylglutathione hydrolase